MLRIDGRLQDRFVMTALTSRAKWNAFVALTAASVVLTVACDLTPPPAPDLGTPQGVLTQARISMQEVGSYRMEGHVHTVRQAGEERVDLSVDWSEPEDMHFVSRRTSVNGEETRELVFVEGIVYVRNPETGGAWRRDQNRPGLSFSPAQLVPRLCRPEFVADGGSGLDEVVIRGKAALHPHRDEELCEAAENVAYTVRVRASDYVLLGYEVDVEGSEDNQDGLRSGEFETAAYTVSRHNEPVTIELPVASGEL